MPVILKAYTLKVELYRDVHWSMLNNADTSCAINISSGHLLIKKEI